MGVGWAGAPSLATLELGSRAERAAQGPQGVPLMRFLFPTLLR